MKIFLVAHRGALGDFVLTWPTLALLRWKYSDHQFVGVGRPEYLKLAQEMGLIDIGYDAESAEMMPLFSGEAMPKLLSATASALLWIGEDEKVRRLLGQTCSGPFHVHAPFPEQGEHVMDYHLQCLPYFSLPAISEEEPFFPLDTRREDYALIHPGSGSESKNYDPEFYAFLANELKNKRFPDTRIVIGPTEKNLKALYNGRFTVVETESVTELARLLSRASLFIGNDSGVSHLSALLGTRTLALFKGENHIRWGVRGREAQSLEAMSEAQAMTRIQKALVDT